MNPSSLGIRPPEMTTGCVDEPVSCRSRDEEDHFQRLNEIGAALSAEHNLDKLLVMILAQAKCVTNADGGTLYLKNTDNSRLDFTVVESDSLNIRMGGTHGPMTWPPVELFSPDGKQNRQMVAALCALTGKIINIPDVYHAEGFDFQGTKAFDKNTGYRSRSMLVIPMRNHENDVIGVCQLINKRLPETGEVISFSRSDEQAALSLASLAAVAITNAQLINDMRILLESFIASISAAIDAKSPYTGGHVRKVAELTRMIAEAINASGEGVYKDVHYDFDQLNELKIAALMHDVGKITTPEYIVDKSRKLETLYDRMETIRTRYEVIRRDLTIALLEKKSAFPDAVEHYENEYDHQMKILSDEINFLESVNLGGETLSNDMIERIKEIAGRTWIDNGVTRPLLSPEEVENLSIMRGTLSHGEREIIKSHAAMSLEILNKLPFPKKLRRVPEIAGTHHEKLNGKGYPRGLSAGDLSLEARILALADIFEALTASDRPYKGANTLSEVTGIIRRMVDKKELDENLVSFFYEQGIHLAFAGNELRPSQRDL